MSSTSGTVRPGRRPRRRAFHRSAENADPDCRCRSLTPCRPSRSTHLRRGEDYRTLPAGSGRRPRRGIAGLVANPQPARCRGRFRYSLPADESHDALVRLAAVVHHPPRTEPTAALPYAPSASLSHHAQCPLALGGSRAPSISSMFTCVSAQAQPRCFARKSPRGSYFATSPPSVPIRRGGSSCLVTAGLSLPRHPARRESGTTPERPSRVPAPPALSRHHLPPASRAFARQRGARVSAGVRWGRPPAA